MKKREYTPSEKKAFKRGFFFGLLKRQKNNKVIKKKINKSSAKLNEYEFIACDVHGNKYNIRTYGITRQDAYDNAQSKLISRDDSLGGARIISVGSHPNAKFNLVFPRY